MSDIKRLIVDNFQSHLHTEVEFGSGLNVVVGPSDFGKSALVRALRWLLYNEPRGANFIRAGAKVCKVTIEMEDGVKVTRLRSTTGKNQYLLQKPDQEKLVFEGFGSDVPVEIMQATKVRKVVIDEHNKVELNMGAQLDGPFLLAETGAIRAKVIGQLGGVHILDWAQRSVNTELRRLGEQENRSQAELEGISSALESYKHLPELFGKIDQLQTLLRQVEGIREKLLELSALKNEWEENTRARARMEKILAQLKGVEQAEGYYQRLKGYDGERRILMELIADLRRVNKQLHLIDQIITKTSQVPAADDRLEGAIPLFQQWRALSSIAEELQGIARGLQKVLQIAGQTKELALVEEQILKIEADRRRWEAYRQLWQGWREHEQSYQGTCLAAERFQKEIDQHLQDFEKVLLGIGKCPVCFGQLGQDEVERVLDEYK